MSRERAVATAFAAAAGVAQLLAHPPFAWFWLALTVPALLVGAVRVDPRNAFAHGFVAALVLHVPLVAWLRFRATIVAWLLLALVMALWGGVLATGIAWLLERRFGVLVMPLWWVGIDAWRNATPWDGFGWATLGITQVDNGWFIPLVRVLGEKGVTLAVVALSVAAWAALDAGLRAQRAASGAHEDGRGAGLVSAAGRRRAQAGHDASMPAAVMLVVVALAVTLTTVAPPPQVGELDALAVQPNDFEHAEGSIVRELAQQALTLTREAVDAGGQPDLVVWPEGTVGIDPARDPQLQDIVVQAGQLTQGRLVMGTDLEDRDSDNFHRVSVQVASDGTFAQTYRKQRLVPFGEYVPLRSMVDWYPALSQVPRDAIASTEPANIVITTAAGDEVTLAVAICFETMYPSTVLANLTAHGRTAQLLVSSTSSSTFGRSAQPEQHLSQMRMRAIETGRWAVHATNSGISALIDQDGRVLTDRTGLYTQATVRGTVGLVEQLTPFARMGDVLDPVARTVALAIGLAVVVTTLRRRSHDRAASSVTEDSA